MQKETLYQPFTKQTSLCMDAYSEIVPRYGNFSSLEFHSDTCVPHFGDSSCI